MEDVTHQTRVFALMVGQGSHATLLFAFQAAKMVSASGHQVLANAMLTSQVTRFGMAHYAPKLYVKPDAFKVLALTTPILVPVTTVGKESFVTPLFVERAATLIMAGN